MLSKISSGIENNLDEFNNVEYNKLTNLLYNIIELSNHRQRRGER